MRSVWVNVHPDCMSSFQVCNVKFGSIQLRSMKLTVLRAKVDNCSTKLFPVCRMATTVVGLCPYYTAMCHFFMGSPSFSGGLGVCPGLPECLATRSLEMGSHF